jgi:hypothetical protein
LYEIDTEAEATVEASAKAPEPAPAVSAPVPAPAVSAPEPKAPPALAVSSSAGGRKPSIQFLGKEGWARALTVQPDLVIPANYGRLEFSEEEVEALWTGGANLAPELKEFSTGAVFSAWESHFIEFLETTTNPTIARYESILAPECVFGLRDFLL